MFVRHVNLLLPFITALAGVLGTMLTYWLVGKRRLTLAHRQRIIEHKSVKFHEYVMKYYMPVLSSIGNFLWRLNKVIEGEDTFELEGEDAYELSFFFFAQYLSTEHIVGKKMKTTFVRDRVTEAVLLYLTDNIIELRSKGFTRNELSKIKKRIDPDELFTDFKFELLRNGELREIFEEKYKPWIRQMKKNTSFIDFLDCYLDLFSFEINDIYTKSWYKENPIKLTSESVDLIEKTALPELRSRKTINLKAEKKFRKKIRRS